MCGPLGACNAAVACINTWAPAHQHRFAAVATNADECAAPGLSVGAAAPADAVYAWGVSTEGTLAHCRTGRAVQQVPAVVLFLCRWTEGSPGT